MIERGDDVPSVGRGSVRTTRQGGPPSKLYVVLGDLLRALDEGQIAGVQIRGEPQIGPVLAALLQMLVEYELQFVLVDTVEGHVMSTLGVELEEITEFVCRMHVGEGNIPLWRGRILLEEFAEKGVEALKRAARSEDDARRRCASTILDLYTLLGVKAEEKLEASQRLLQLVLDYVKERPDVLLVYRGARAPYTLYTRGRAIFFAEEPEPPSNYIVVEIRDGALNIHGTTRVARKWRRLGFGRSG